MNFNLCSSSNNTQSEDIFKFDACCMIFVGDVENSHALSWTLGCQWQRYRSVCQKACNVLWLSPTPTQLTNHDFRSSQCSQIYTLVTVNKHWSNGMDWKQATIRSKTIIGFGQEKAATKIVRSKIVEHLPNTEYSVNTKISLAIIWRVQRNRYNLVWNVTLYVGKQIAIEIPRAGPCKKSDCPATGNYANRKLWPNQNRISFNLYQSTVSCCLVSN